MSGHVICTNNPNVAAKYPGLSCFIKGSVTDVFTAVRDSIHKGARVISHPLSGSIKPNETPYKSVVIYDITGPLDYKSLQIIEDAIDVIKRLPSKLHDYDASILADFRIIDLDHINSAISNINEVKLCYTTS